MDTPTALDLAAADRFAPTSEVSTVEGKATYRWGIDGARNFYAWSVNGWEPVYCEDVPEDAQRRLVAS